MIDITTIAHEAFCDIIDTIPHTEPYNITAVYIPVKDRLILCVNTDNPEYRKYITIEDASYYESLEDLFRLDTFDYGVLGL